MNIPLLFALAVLLVLSFVGCDKSAEVILPLSEVPGGGIRLNDAAKQEKLKNELEHLGVKYWEQKDGTITYLLIETANFRKAERKAIYGDELRPNVREGAFHLSENELAIFKAELDNAGIQYDEIVDKTTGVVIYWGQPDGPQVDEIIQRVKVEAYKQFMSESREKIY